ncbi:MAG: hypothetical protein KDA58_10465 [Planctomycetaceae bacterium]|nr:hypothetical protein [Planctomycetaceae bacterium]
MKSLEVIALLSLLGMLPIAWDHLQQQAIAQTECELRVQVAVQASETRMSAQRMLDSETARNRVSEVMASHSCTR